MRWSQTLCLLIMLGGIGVWTPARSEPCLDVMLNTYQKADCWVKQSDDAKKKTLVSYNRALDAAKNMLADGWKVDFRPDIQTTQEKWEQWMRSQCALEADATLGSAGAFVGSICQVRLTRERTKALDTLAEQLPP